MCDCDEYDLSLIHISPSLGNLSAIEQVIDSLQLQRGNPQLEAYMRYRLALTYEFQNGIFYTNLDGAYEYLPNPIMDEKFQEGDVYKRQG